MGYANKSYIKDKIISAFNELSISIELLEKINKRGMETEGMEHYLSAFKHGMPPHGGLGIGLERLTMQLIGEENVREATLFPRDLSRLEP